MNNETDVERNWECEDVLGVFDDDELEELIRLGKEAIAEGDVISMEEAKRRLGYPDGKVKVRN